MDADVVLRGGQVLDGTGAAAVEADVAVRDGRVIAVGRLGGARSAQEIDASGQVVAPGFIDAHVHSDLASFLPDDSDDVRVASLRQGVTTEVCGNCGFSTFPALPHRLGDLTSMVRGIFGDMTHAYPTLGDYRTALSERDLPVNLVPLTGHGALRAGVIGLERRAPTDVEAADMVAALEQTIDDGAYGLSSGLIYAPGMYADIDELVVLARVLARHGLPYTTHLRSEFAAVEVAVEEAIEIGRRSAAAIHISHHKVAGRANYGRIGATLARIEKARAEGLDVTCDVYPYAAGSTSLHALLPPWVTEGGLDAVLSRVAQEDVRRRIAHDIEHGIEGWPNNVGSEAGWADVAIAYAPGSPEVEGLRITEIAAATGQSAIDVVGELLLASEGAVMIVVHQMDEPDVREVLSRPYTMIGSDAVPLPGKPHPRLAGTFSRVLGHYGRGEGLLALPDAVRKMTSATADRFGLTGRGRLVEGAIADLVVLDPATVLDTATYADPVLRPVGVRHVFVGGRHAIRDGQVVDAGAGRLLGRR
jgi:N-acyl-D-aspartate/D-glutamate deacylase